MPPIEMESEYPKTATPVRQQIVKQIDKLYGLTQNNEMLVILQNPFFIDLASLSLPPLFNNILTTILTLS